MISPGNFDHLIEFARSASNPQWGKKKSEVCLHINDSERFFSTDTKQKLVKIPPNLYYYFFLTSQN